MEFLVLPSDGALEVEEEQNPNISDCIFTFTIKVKIVII